MKKEEISSDPERGYHLFKTSDTAVRMILERITLQRQGLALNALPLCTEEESVHIEEIIPRAKHGFALAFTSDRSRLDQDRDLIKLTLPSSESFSNLIGLTKRQNTLFEYWHVLATLEILSQFGKVSFFQFPDSPPNLDYQTGMAETYWLNSTDSFESAWVLMEELENLTRAALYSSNPMQNTDILKLGHFFMTAKTISSVFDN